MTIDLIWVGKTQDAYVREGIADFESRLKRHVRFSTIELKSEKKWSSEDDLKNKEGERILNALNGYDCVVLLDERGKRMRSLEFASYLNRKGLESTRKIAFVIAGAFGAHQTVKSRADLLLSLSDMTFNHQVVRLMFLEQLYRAHMINKDIPYHHE